MWLAAKYTMSVYGVFVWEDGRLPCTTRVSTVLWIARGSIKNNIELYVLWIIHAKPMYNRNPGTSFSVIRVNMFVGEHLGCPLDNRATVDGSVLLALGFIELLGKG